MAQHSLAHDARETVEAQIAELRDQLHSISRSLHDRGFDIEHLRDEARDVVSGAAKNARRAAHFAQDEVKAVAKVARKNPAGASTALTLAAAIGFGIGYALCQIQNEDRRNHHWW